MLPPPSLSEYRLTEHALFEMARRRISEAEVASVLRAPEQVLASGSARFIYQSRVSTEGKTRLLRVVVDIEGEQREVVTAYLTSKIGKYWREER